MPPAPGNLRGVKTVRRPRTGGPAQALTPYKAYMAVTALEMEKHRHQIERQNLATRLRYLSARLRSIDAEITALLNRAGVPRLRRVGERGAPGGDPSSPRTGGDFKLQY